MSAAWGDSLNSGAVPWASVVGRACWQGGLALALVWAGCRVWPGLPPRVRCWLWRLAYLKLLVALLWATPVDLPLLPAPRPPAAVAAPAATTRVAPLPHSRLGPTRAAVAPEAPSSARVPLTTAMGGLLLLWLLGAGGYAARVAWEWGEVWRLCRQSEPVRHEGLTACCAVLCQRLGLRRAPRLLAAAGTGSPLLMGILRPAILLPASLLDGCSPTDWELMLAHELAHLKRRDLLWSWLPALAQGVFWFHPLVWLGGQEWRLSQEMACDEMAVWVTHLPAADYGEVLLKIAAQRPVLGRERWGTVGVLETYHTLQRRLSAMKSIGRMSHRQWLSAGVALAALGVVTLVPWRVVAQSGPSQPVARRLMMPTDHVRSVAASPAGGAETDAAAQYCPIHRFFARWQAGGGSGLHHPALAAGSPAQFAAAAGADADNAAGSCPIHRFFARWWSGH